MRTAVLILTVVLVAGAVLTSPVVRPGARSTTAGENSDRLAQSIEFFEERLRVDPHNRSVASRLADRYVLRFQTMAQFADLARAEELVRSGLPISMDPATDHARLATLFLMQHRFEDALVAARRAMALSPESEAARGALFDAALAAGEYDLADSLLAAGDPEELGWRVRRATWLDMQGQSQAAVDAMASVCARLERSAARAEVRAWCLTELAGIRHGTEGPAAAAATLDVALSVLPGYRGAVEAQADLAHARRDWGRARKLYNSIATDAHPDLYLRLAEVHVQLGDEPAAAEYERAFLSIARQPDTEGLYAVPLALYYGRRLMTIDTAVAIIERDLRRRSAVESYDVLSWLQLARGRLAAALAASDQALRWGAPSPTMLYHRARILEAVGRATDAAVLMDRALEHETLLEPHVRLALASAGSAASLASSQRGPH